MVPIISTKKLAPEPLKTVFMMIQGVQAKGLQGYVHVVMKLQQPHMAVLLKMILLLLMVQRHGKGKELPMMVL